jgi:hypothetical protein
MDSSRYSYKSPADGGSQEHGGLPEAGQAGEREAVGDGAATRGQNRGAQ